MTPCGSHCRTLPHPSPNPPNPNPALQYHAHTPMGCSETPKGCVRHPPADPPKPPTLPFGGSARGALILGRRARMQLTHLPTLRHPLPLTHTRRSRRRQAAAAGRAAAKVARRCEGQCAGAGFRRCPCYVDCGVHCRVTLAAFQIRTRAHARRVGKFPSP